MPWNKGISGSDAVVTSPDKLCDNSQGTNKYILRFTSGSALKLSHAGISSSSPLLCFPEATVSSPDCLVTRTGLCRHVSSIMSARMSSGEFFFCPGRLNSVRWWGERALARVSSVGPSLASSRLSCWGDWPDGLRVELVLGRETGVVVRVHLGKGRFWMQEGHS